MIALLQAATELSTAWNWVAISFTLLGELLALTFVARLLARGGSPSTTLLWVVVILAAPWLGMGLYYLFPRRLQVRRLKRIRQKQQRWRDELRMPRASGMAEPEGEQAPLQPLQRLLLGLAPDGFSHGNAVGWLPSGADFFAAAARAIDAAQSFVHFEVYIFRPDAAGTALLARLEAAARRGVAVRLLYDSMGSFGLKARHLAALRAAGGRAEPFLPLLWKRRPFTVNLRNHRKLLVVDGRIAFLGGRNIGDEYATDRLGRRRSWYDAMVQVEGPAVADLQHVFLEDWFNATEEELTDPALVPLPARAGGECLGVTRSGPDGAAKALWFSVLQAIHDAHTTLDISSPYLVPPPTLLVALILAASRGVRVRIFTNGRRSEAPVLYQAQRSYYRELGIAGVEIHETVDDYNHAKVLVADGRTVMVGSANLDMRSVHLNFELAIFVPDSPRLAEAVLATLAERARTAVRVDIESLHSSRVSRLIDGICRLLSPIL